jgi:transposase-like protein
MFADHTLAVIREALVPSLRRRVPDDELAPVLALLKRDGARPLRELAALHNMHPVTLRRWLKAAGKLPQGLGGGSGREEMYLLSDAQEVVEERKGARKQ